jgi:hypothetical protein
MNKMQEVITKYELNDPFTLMAILLFVAIIAIIWYGAFKINKLIKKQSISSYSTLERFQMATSKEEREKRKNEITKNLQNIVDQLSISKSKSYTVELHDKSE